MQTPLTFSNIPAGTRSVSDEGPNMPGQDVPDTSLELSNMSPLIAELSP